MRGPWQHDAEPLYEGGGHCTLFRTLDEKVMLVLHAPNRGPDERARLFEVDQSGDKLTLLRWPR